MNTKFLLSASALVLGAAGVVGSFAPAEIADALELEAGVTIVMQLLAALYFAFAMLNWFARGSLIGGIYNRPVVVANLSHFVIGALALTRLVVVGDRRPAYAIAAVVYVLFAIVFGAILLRSPVTRPAEPDRIASAG